MHRLKYANWTSKHTYLLYKLHAPEFVAVYFGLVLMQLCRISRRCLDVRFRIFEFLGVLLEKRLKKAIAGILDSLFCPRFKKCKIITHIFWLNQKSLKRISCWPDNTSAYKMPIILKWRPHITQICVAFVTHICKGPKNYSFIEY